MLKDEPRPVGLSEGDTQEPSPSPAVFDLGAALSEGIDIGKALTAGALRIRVLHHRDMLWVVCERGGDGGLALRVPLLNADAKCRVIARGTNDLLRVVAQSELGRHDIVIDRGAAALDQFHLSVDFTAKPALHLNFLPRDLIPFARGGDPLATAGVVEAKQRKLNTGLVYLTIAKPAFGKVLYVQNFTALADHFEASGTSPESTVGGDWPELGYLPPTRPHDASRKLPAGRKVRIYDTFLVARARADEREDESAWQFLDMLSAVYRWIDRPHTQHRDWIARSRATLRDLAKAPEARVRHYGNVYFHPYTGAEEPDVMVQMSLLSAIHDWGAFEGKPHPLAAQIRKGLGRFYDRKLGTLRRYLPDVGPDKDADAVDSWYLYHPLLNLSNLALAGDDKAKTLFLGSLDYGIKSAHHFAYKWPIQYKIDTFEVITAVAADERGQTDVGGLYAWVMLQAYQLTAEERFLAEAKAAIAAAQGMRFGLNYQANLTAWGAAACIRLWRITGDKTHLGQSYVYLASFFHNTQIWESRIGAARHFCNFLGVTCLEDAPYMALYECFDSFAAFERYLDYGGPDLIASARLLVSEYCRYALTRAWSYYPDALPADILATDIRNGHIDRSLSFPLEDLYSDGQPPGQVGQEIYGSGAAMIFATRMFRNFAGAPFRLYCDHFVRAAFQGSDRALSFRLDGEPGTRARIGLVRAGRRRLPNAQLHMSGDDKVAPEASGTERIEWIVPAASALLLTW